MIYFKSIKESHLKIGLSWSQDQVSGRKTALGLHNKSKHYQNLNMAKSNIQIRNDEGEMYSIYTFSTSATPAAAMQ